MKAERWVQEVTVCGENHQVEFIRRPFREGLEVRVALQDTVITVAELGLGEAALLERIRGLLESHLKAKH